CVGAITGLDYW
nr:immunoglobulin heavy chain junction region [Macaca mulatta]